MRSGGCRRNERNFKRGRGNRATTERQLAIGEG
jgi:hypothetical protein